MLDTTFIAAIREEGARQLLPQWNQGMIAASIAVSLLGAFTSTQLFVSIALPSVNIYPPYSDHFHPSMCQARVSLNFSAALIWTILGSLTFGFCSIWSLHFIATLACELDLQIGINVPLTLLSSVLAVSFTFAALTSDLLWERYSQGPRRKERSLRTNGEPNPFGRKKNATESSRRPLLAPMGEDDGPQNEFAEGPSSLDIMRNSPLDVDENTPLGDIRPKEPTHDREQSLLIKTHAVHDQTIPSLPELDSTTGFTDSLQGTLSDHSISRRSSIGSTSTSSYGFSTIMNLAYRSTKPAKNAFLATGEALYGGFTRKNITKGFLWSLAITSMHYVGILALRIPDGYFTINIFLVILSGIISWIVCIIGCILMSQMETHLTQQFLFSAVATTGVAAMHFTGMRAVTFWSTLPASAASGYPPALAIAIVSIAITTCIIANGLLAHAATVSRNKLAEIVLTRRKLWRTIAAKENAEAAAAARSDFIASASHEIRTPLHHLQGYSDLLSQTELTEEGRMLLSAIQRATKTLSLITNNVLDWSKLERDAETVCRPVSLDVRTVCESILVLLPNKDDESAVELMVVVSPQVPSSLFLDETYIHRILMNLLSNALKFTRSGYILLLIEMENRQLTATVRDTGCGVPPSFLPQLFEPFKQAQSRGSQRGTGLGLSIVKQLLRKMEGDIEVESVHPETGDVGSDQTGSTFKIKIPLSTSFQQELSSPKTPPRVAIFRGSGDNIRSVEGMQMAWEKFEFEAVVVETFSDLSGFEWKYIWVDIPFLKQNQQCLGQLLEQDKWFVLVPYETPQSLHQIPGLLSARRFIPLQKPLIWHSFKQRIAAASQVSNKIALSRSVRFAPNVEVLDRDGKELPQGPTAKNLLILLVEDNPINQRLGKKMLLSLGYQVLVAENGQDAIEQVIKHDPTIDAILMDQSMPEKDGVTATRELRAMEAAGTLSRKRPIIAVTAVVNAEAQELFKAAGTDDFLAKPLSLSRLEKTLTAHLPSKLR